MIEQWAAIVASSLTWEQAHASLDSAVKSMPAELRARRPADLPHSVWELVEHIRITQRDLLDFCANPDYEETMKWPDDYWPRATASVTDAEWKASLETIRADAVGLGEFAKKNAATLTERIPHGTGQTYLRTVLVAVDHTSYHAGQIVLVRRLLGAWPPA